MTSRRHSPRRPWPLDARENTILSAIQRALPWSWTVRFARSLSFIAEHALAWVILAGFAALVDTHHRAAWIGVLIATVFAHFGASAIKLVVRRPRPHDPAVHTLGATHSTLSFPSSHAAGTTAFAVGAALIFPGLIPVSVVLILLMALARMRLGVHYPSDVVAGIVLGSVCAGVASALAG